MLSILNNLIVRAFILAVLMIGVQADVTFTFHAKSGVVGLAGYYAYYGGQDIIALKDTCYGNWRNADVDGFSCVILGTQAVTKHVLAFVVAAVGPDVVADMAGLIFGEGSSQKGKRPDEKDELKRSVTSYQDLVDGAYERQNYTMSSLLDKDAFEVFAKSLYAPTAVSNGTVTPASAKAVQAAQACPVIGFDMRDGWFSFRNNHGIKAWCKQECDSNVGDSYDLGYVVDRYAEAMVNGGGMRGQFTLWNTAVGRTIARCGLVMLNGGSDTCVENIEDGGRCLVPDYFWNDI